MRAKPTEVRLVASLLMGEADDAEELAGRIIQALDEKRARDNTPWAIVYHDPNTGTVIPYGPFPTASAAEKVRKDLVSPGPLPARAGTFRLRAKPCA